MTSYMFRHQLSMKVMYVLPEAWDAQDIEAFRPTLVVNHRTMLCRSGNRIKRDAELGKAGGDSEVSSDDDARRNGTGQNADGPKNQDELMDEKLMHTGMPEGRSAPLLTRSQRFKKAALHGLTFDIHKILEKDKELRDLHDRAEVFEPRTEMSFAYLQVISSLQKRTELSAVKQTSNLLKTCEFGHRFCTS